MPLYMDKHNMGEGVSIEDVAQAHQADLQTQGKHDVNYIPARCIALCPAAVATGSCSVVRCEAAR